MDVEKLEERIKYLEEKLQRVEDIEAIKKLQRAYGYYLEHWMSKELIDLFSDSPEAMVDIHQGKWYGKKGIERLFNTFFPNIGSPELLHMMMQLSGIVDVDPDGKSARGRWYGFGMTAVPSSDGKVRQGFMNGIYQCGYVKENGKWKIKVLQFNKTLGFPPGQGWVSPERVSTLIVKNPQNIVPDSPRTVEPGYPTGYIVPFHFNHPVTGEKPLYKT